MAHFMKRNDTPGADKLSRAPDKSDRICLMDEHIAPHHQVETGFIDKILDRISLKDSLRISRRECPLLRHRDSIPAAIYADHGAAGSDHFACEHRDITSAAADIEHPHARRDAGLTQQTLSDRPEDSSLQYESANFRC